MRLLLYLFIFTFTPIVFSQTAVEKGLQIIQAVDRQNSGFKDESSILKMILKDRNGSISQRDMRNKLLEVENDGDKNLIVFDEPRDVKGTALLTFAHKTGDDDQWLYLPALKRVKRISSSNKSGPFMGSEFAYEDINNEEIEKYTYKHIETINYEGNICEVIERYPVDTKSGYSKQIVWIHQADLKPMKIEYFDTKGLHLKTLTFSDYKLYLDKYWRAHTMHMINKINDKESTLQFSDFKYQNNYTDRDFDKNSLQSIR